MSMELEELNKSQIVLLTLLVSFVTSIATGIVTVSLLEQAPADVTRVIQKTVERTIEKVTPPEIQTKIVTQEKTIIVSEADLIANAVELNTPSIVRIYSGAEDAELLGLGIVISAGGIIATDMSIIEQDTEYIIKAMSAEYTATIINSNEVYDIALLELTDSNTVPRPASISTGDIKAGSSVVLLSGSQSLYVDTGLISELSEDAFATNFEAESILPGSVLINIDGNVVGISTATSRDVGGGWFVPARKILSTLNSPEKVEEDQDVAQSTPLEQQTATATATATTDGVSN